MDEDKIEREIANFNNQLIPFGYMDVKVAVEIALEIGQGGDWVAEQIQDFIDSTGDKLEDIDPVYVVYYSIFQLCRNEIDTYTNKDIWNDLNEVVETYGNFMCTSYDGTETAVKETLKLAKKVPNDEQSKELKWFIEQLEEMY